LLNQNSKIEKIEYSFACFTIKLDHEGNGRVKLLQLHLEIDKQKMNKEEGNMLTKLETFQ
jgi:hypothetical protein